ncbi:DUF1553 domain-containing protein [Calycomorphotria hydatis]|uniref:Planctomycete cytochrome C n=1 Tax=Calycomorphotria hydatis TaxID=2528027 RepID=A0A517T9X1_9PLAN|nr:DUF1553 domain-containing protein [Calycomorphotria hydatis]QDT65171.1 Planctomycete cytochrome C [Calycomorphotria hydatis]
MPTNLRKHCTAYILCIGSVVLLLDPALAEDISQKMVLEQFKTVVAPALSSKCVACHQAANLKGELDLTTREGMLKGGDGGEALYPGDADNSSVYYRAIPWENDPPEMPEKGDALTPEEAEALRAWIVAGAPWPEGMALREKSKADASFWSYQPIADIDVPHVENVPQEWQKNPVDQFVFSKLSEEGLTPNGPADRTALIRRATYDLTGLPPTPEEVAAFLNDGDPQAYERLIDRLLESPHYGERWGRHWLDVIRFGESNGFERNFIINTLWPFRDYVIRSINEDKPFDQFISEHIAGDVINRNNPDVAVGSAFLVAGPYDDVGNQDPIQKKQIRANTLDEIISATGQAFLGMTLGCARCHDHKFDPILQEDYYSLYATFSGVRHGEVPLATTEARTERNERLKPLNEQLEQLVNTNKELQKSILERAYRRESEYDAMWSRPAVSRLATEETFEPVSAKFVRLVCEAQDVKPNFKHGFKIDEFEVWSAGEQSRNVALSQAGSKAFGDARKIEDFPDAYGPQLAIDGKFGARFIATGDRLTIELAEPTQIHRVVFSSHRDGNTPQHQSRKFTFVADYRIEVSLDGKQWQKVADGSDRLPVDEILGREQKIHRDHRMNLLETTPEEKAELSRIQKEIAAVEREIRSVPALPIVWIGRRVAADAKGPFHVFVGGNPQRNGSEVTPTSMSVMDQVISSYELPEETDEATRRTELANWITHPDNPLTLRTLANRIWHYHFGVGIVDTPNDLGYMGGRPTHPELLDYLADQLRKNGWRLKPMHRLIMLSETYRQSSGYREEAASIDGDARLLWRFPPRRLSSEEIRDTILEVSGKLNKKMGGPGFRMYHFMQDNVCTYKPLDEFGSETYRRAVYHQNARASVVDLMTEFDQPDCTFSAPRRAETTTPLQALTMLNHSFTLDMSEFLAERLEEECGDDHSTQIRRAYKLCYSRDPSSNELTDCVKFVQEYGLAAYCRVLLNTSEMIYLR